MTCHATALASSTASSGGCCTFSARLLRFGCCRATRSTKLRFVPSCAIGLPRITISFSTMREKRRSPNRRSVQLCTTGQRRSARSRCCRQRRSWPSNLRRCCTACAATSGRTPSGLQSSHLLRSASASTSNLRQVFRRRRSCSQNGCQTMTTASSVRLSLSGTRSSTVTAGTTLSSALRPMARRAVLPLQALPPPPLSLRHLLRHHRRRCI